MPINVPYILFVLAGDKHAHTGVWKVIATLWWCNVRFLRTLSEYPKWFNLKLICLRPDKECVICQI